MKAHAIFRTVPESWQVALVLRLNKRVTVRSFTGIGTWLRPAQVTTSNYLETGFRRVKLCQLESPKHRKTTAAVSARMLLNGVKLAPSL